MEEKSKLFFKESGQTILGKEKNAVPIQIKTSAITTIAKYYMETLMCRKRRTYLFTPDQNSPIERLPA